MMDAGVWMIPTLAVRVLLYSCVAGAIGGCLSSILLQQHRELFLPIIRYTQRACMAGALVSIASISIQTGTLAQAGIAGLFDRSILSVLLTSAVGAGLALQLMGFLLVGMSRVYLDRYALFSHVSAICGACLLAVSFAQTGHMAEKGLVGQTAVTLHVSAMALWVGSLYPLWLAARSNDTVATQIAMRKFGEWAVFIVGLLVLCGITMATLMLGDWDALFHSAYGKGLLAKFVLVAGLLLLAATNKWLWVPQLGQAGASERLSHSIVFEISVASAVLITTAVVVIAIGSEA